MFNIIRIILVVFLFSLKFCTFAQWNLLVSSGGNHYTVDCINDSTCLVCGAKVNVGTFILKTVDYAITWDTVYFDEIGLVRDLDMVNDSVGFACGFNKKILKTVDGGNTWTDISVSKMDIPFYMDFSTIKFLDEEVGFVGNADWLAIFAKTIDGGMSWEIVDEVEGARDINITSNMVTSIGGSVFFTSLDLGDTWNYNILNTTNRSFYSAEMVNEDFWFIGGMGQFGEINFNYGLLSESNDGGETWSHYDVWEFQSISDVHFFNDEIGYATGQAAVPGYHFLKTLDGGEFWGYQTIELENPNEAITMRSISCPSEDICYAVGANKILRTLNGGGEIHYDFEYSTFTAVEENLPQKGELVLFPNPVQTTFSIDLKDIRLMEASLEIYNSSGLLIKSQMINSGVKTLNIDVEDLASGFYSVVIKDGEKIIQESFVKE